MSYNRTAPATGTVSPAAKQSITAGGTAQLVFDSTVRNFLFLQNTSSQDLWIGFGVTPVVSGAGFMKLSAGSTYEFQGCFVPSNAIYIIGNTTNQTFVALQG
jgi:hypothetical protein